VFAAGPSIEQDAVTFHDLVSVNLRAPYFLTAAIAPHMVARGTGSIINISSTVAQLGTPGTSIYAATKAALESLTRTWAAEFAAGGVRVNTVTPGAVRTHKVVSLLGDATDDLGKTTLIGRIGEAHEIAQTVLFLASDRASYVTGTNIAVNGGRTSI
jgi:NAD(P)-dependent dehydrogenase (short-subunit alcohol dehydrogenase family)